MNAIVSQRRVFLTAALFFVTVACPLSSWTETITFDGILSKPFDYGAVPAEFAGLHWQNFSVFFSSGCAGVKYEYTDTGYCHLTDALGIVSQAYLFGRYGQTPIATMSSDTPFALNSAILAAAWNNDVVLSVNGYRNGEVVDSMTIPLQTGFGDCKPGPICTESDQTFPSTVNFGWTNLDEVSFQGVGGHSTGVGSILFPYDYQANVIIGEIDITPTQTPEPTTILVTGISLLFMGVLQVKRPDLGLKS